jgi:hypothetical protein
LNILYDLRDDQGRKFSEKNQQLSENVLATLVTHDYLNLTDLYSTSLTCKGWNLVVESKIGSIGLRRRHQWLTSRQTDWKESFLRRHTTQSKAVRELLGVGESSPVARETKYGKAAIQLTLGKQREARKGKKDWGKELEELQKKLASQKQEYEKLCKFKQNYDEAKKASLLSSSDSTEDLSQIDQN